MVFSSHFAKLNIKQAKGPSIISLRESRTRSLCEKKNAAPDYTQDEDIITTSGENQRFRCCEPKIRQSTNHMLGIDNYVPLTQQNFEIRIYNMDGTTPSEFSDLLTLSTKEISEISEDEGTIDVHYGNGVIKFPDKVTYDDVDWTLNCFTTPNVIEALRAWRNQVYDPITEKMGLPQQYMRQVFFIKYDGQGNPRDVIRCPGTWIKNLKNGSMTQEGGLVEVSVTLVISKAIYMKPEDFQ